LHKSLSVPLPLSDFLDIISDITEVPMGQILIRNINDSALETLRARAVLKGSSLEAEVRQLIESGARPDKSELLRALAQIRAKTNGPVASLTLDEIREGLE
jgi:antitoxin FitA